MKKTLLQRNKEKFVIKKTSYGFGLFAKESIKKGGFVIEYVGPKVTIIEGERRGGKYLMTLDDKYTIDGKSRDNLARYINHSCKPNCIVYTDMGHIRVYARKNIKIGDELNYNYGKEYWNYYIKPHSCKCDACLKKEE